MLHPTSSPLLLLPVTTSFPHSPKRKKTRKKRSQNKRSIFSLTPPPSLSHTPPYLFQCSFTFLSSSSSSPLLHRCAVDSPSPASTGIVGPPSVPPSSAPPPFSFPSTIIYLPTVEPLFFGREEEGGGRRRFLGAHAPFRGCSHSKSPSQVKPAHHTTLDFFFLSFSLSFLLPRFPP